MISKLEKIDGAVAATLDRHQQRRQRGVPTVSVLVGPVILATDLLREWAGTHHRRVVLVQPEQPDPKFTIVPWVDELAKRYDLKTAAVHWLARELNRAPESIQRLLRSMTPHEVRIFLQSAVPLESETRVECVARSLIEKAAAGMKLESSNLSSNLDLLLESHGRPWLRVIRAIGELVPSNWLPVLVLSPREQDVTRLDDIARLLAELAVAQPQVALVLVVEPVLFDSYLALTPASRAKALLRESIVKLTWSNLPTAPDPESTPVSPRNLASSHLAGCDLDSEIGDLESEKENSDDDQARSAAERFLFERLESIAETAGLFELNVPLDFYFGPNRWVEVDLTARSLKLAIEVDGYHHFLDREAFRRDRRKDLELQKHGYLVVRVLADDVVERLEDVMNMILTTVAFRRTASVAPEAKS